VQLLNVEALLALVGIEQLRQELAALAQRGGSATHLCLALVHLLVGRVVIGLGLAVRGHR